MKTGIILQIIGSEKKDLNMNHKQKIKELKLKADYIVFTSPTMGHVDIYTAWLELVKKDMGEIILKQAKITDENSLKLTGKDLLLQGIV